MTIIHGPNGYGKTVLLEMIDAFLNGRRDVFERIPFQEFRVLYDDASLVRVVRHIEDESDARKPQPKIDTIFRDTDGHETVMEGHPDLGAVPHAVLNYVDKHVPSKFVRSGDGWRDTATGEFASLSTIVSLFPRVQSALPAEYGMRAYAGPPPVPATFFIETKRLAAEREASQSAVEQGLYGDLESSILARRRVPNDLRVQQYSADIVLRIKASLADYAKHSQERDRTFPERLVAFIREEGRPLPESQIVESMHTLEEKRKRLVALGFLDQETGLTNLTEEDVERAAGPLTIYVDDVAKKLSAFDDLADRVGQLMDIVNSRYKYKSLAVDRDRGFSLQTHLGDSLALESLSSGEQHELVVLYELLFRSPRAGLVLVDEPEISLHAAWQSSFLSDLIAILKLSQSYAIVATHSPVVIGNRWDLTQRLKGPATTSGGVEE